MKKENTENALQAVDLMIDAQARYYEQSNAPKTRHTEAHQKEVDATHSETCF